MIRMYVGVVLIGYLLFKLVTQFALINHRSKKKRGKKGGKGRKLLRIAASKLKIFQWNFSSSLVRLQE